MNPWKTFLAWRYERNYQHSQRELVKAYTLVAAHQHAVAQAAFEKAFRDEVSRGIADLESEANRHRRDEDAS